MSLPISGRALTRRRRGAAVPTGWMLAAVDLLEARRFGPLPRLILTTARGLGNTRRVEVTVAARDPSLNMVERY